MSGQGGSLAIMQVTIQPAPFLSLHGHKSDAKLTQFLPQG